VRWFVDASNVIGSRPDGWWRDRAGATERLLDAARTYARRTGDDLIVVLDAGPRELASEEPGLTVAFAPRPGRDAADREIARRLAEEADRGAVGVATSDRALAERARELGAQVEGARAFRERLGF
jgi:predicted RNA-binding protein with PIN domain